MRDTAVLVDGLHVRFAATSALAGVDVEARAGTTLAVLGHNGAGKTTLIRVLATLVRPTAGRAYVDGLDVVADAAGVRRRIGVTGQYAGLDEFLTARENLVLVGRLLGLRGEATRRADELVERFDLGAFAERRVGELSGGSRRRVDLAASLVGSPSVLFLDEPTTGLDPMARAALWDVVENLTATGTTVVLTTQYLEEADRLADSVVVLEHGVVAAQGTPDELKRIVGGKVVAVTVAADAIPAMPTGGTTEGAADGRVRVSYMIDDAERAALVLREIADRGVEFIDVDVKSPTLDDVVAHVATGASA